MRRLESKTFRVSSFNLWKRFKKLVVKAEVESLKRYLSVFGVTGFDENR